MCTSLWNCHEKLDYKILFATSFVAAALPIYAVLVRPHCPRFECHCMSFTLVSTEIAQNLTVLHVCEVVSQRALSDSLRLCWMNFEYFTRFAYCQYLLLLQGCVIFHRWMTTFKFDIPLVVVYIHLYYCTYVSEYKTIHYNSFNESNQTHIWIHHWFNLVIFTEIWSLN